MAPEHSSEHFSAIILPSLDGYSAAMPPRVLSTSAASVTIYLAFQEADHYQDEIFVLDTVGGEALTFLTRPPGEGG